MLLPLPPLLYAGARVGPTHSERHLPSFRSLFEYALLPAGHQQSECPKKAIDVYRLPDQLQTRVDEMYAKVERGWSSLVVE